MFCPADVLDLTLRAVSLAGDLEAVADPGSTSSRAVILLSVRVPVLSEQIAEVEPRVSTAGSRFMIALRSASARVPIESSVVTTAGRPVGIAATASAIPVMNNVSKRLAADQADHHDHERERDAGDDGDDLRQAVELLLERRLVRLGVR